MPWTRATWLVEGSPVEHAGEIELSTYDHKPRCVHGMLFVRQPGDSEQQVAIPVRRIASMTWVSGERAT